MMLYLRQYSINLAKGFSQAYILITRIPDRISLIERILSSVRNAVFILSRENTFPIQPKTGFQIGEPLEMYLKKS